MIINTYRCHPVPPWSGLLCSRPNPGCSAGSVQILVVLFKGDRISSIRVVCRAGGCSMFVEGLRKALLCVHMCDKKPKRATLREHLHHITCCHGCNGFGWAVLRNNLTIIRSMTPHLLQSTVWYSQWSFPRSLSPPPWTRWHPAAPPLRPTSGYMHRLLSKRLCIVLYSMRDFLWFRRPRYQVCACTWERLEAWVSARRDERRPDMRQRE